MPADLFSRINLDFLYPPALRAHLQLAANCREEGSDYWALYGERDYIEQGKLFALWQSGKGGRAAPPGSSAHHWGIAVDYCKDEDPSKTGLQPVWHSKAYDLLGTEARKLGLVWGGGFGDRPHVQWPWPVSGNDMEPLRALYAQGTSKLERLKLCWDFLDQKQDETWKKRFPNLVQFL